MSAGSRVGLRHSRLDTSFGTTRALAILAPGDDPPTEDLARRVQRFCNRLLCSRPHGRGILRWEEHALCKLPARKCTRRVAEERRVVDARCARRECQRQRGELNTSGCVLVVRVRRVLLLCGCWRREAAQRRHIWLAAPADERRGHARRGERGCC